MFTRTAIGFAVVGYAVAFSGMAPLALKPSSTLRLPLRASGTSMSIGVFYGTTTGNTESVAKRVSVVVTMLFANGRLRCYLVGLHRAISLQNIDCRGMFLLARRMHSEL